MNLPMIMADERSESARDNFGKFIYQLRRKTKTLFRKLERILIKLYRQNLSLFFNRTCIRIYVCMHVCMYVCMYVCVRLRVRASS